VEVEPGLLASASGMASGTRALAVFHEQWAAQPSGPVCVYLHGVHDPGNVGAVLRAAEAFGAGSVALGPGSADPFGPKAVRASMGAVFAVPVARVHAIDELPGLKIALVPGEGLALHELWPSATTPRWQMDKDLTIIVGSEREGLAQTIIDQADQTAHIPIKTDSLNAAMAATVALYELALRMQKR
jgi:TrmH family RNA methyltransferase